MCTCFSGELYECDYMQFLSTYLVLLHNVMMSFEKPDLVVDSLTALYHILYHVTYLYWM